VSNGGSGYIYWVDVYCSFGYVHCLDRVCIPWRFWVLELNWIEVVVLAFDDLAVCELRVIGLCSENWV
jgi:hypothetical protein